MRIILTRHGRTVENDAGILQWHLPGTLNDVGRGQAKKIAKRLESEPIAHAYSSDLSRAAETAREIMRFHQSAPLEFTGELREIYLGEWQGKTKAELGLIGNPEAEAKGPRDGETTEALLVRARSFVENVLAKHSNETVLVVGHSSLNRRIVTAITGKTDVRPSGNASVSIFDIDSRGGVHIECLDCRRHLE